MEIELDGNDARFIVAVEDVSGVWGVLKPILESRTTWRNLQLRNKVGNSVSVAQLQVQYMLANSPRLTRLRQHAQSPVTWFRNPYVQLILISGDDTDEYKRSLKGQLRKVLDRERDLLGGVPEFVIAYMQPSGTDSLSKGVKKVFEAVKNDLGTRKKDRAVKLELGPRGSVTPGTIAELERQLADALKATFEARQAAYDEEVRKLAAARQQPGWSFSTLFLVKDSLAVMLESAGLLEDALREYAELDALYLTTLQPPDSPNAPPFGGTAPGDDVAQLVRATWRETRQAVLRSGLPQFDLQQFLFACQARILLKLDRPAEVAQRGLAAVDNFAAALEQQVAAGRLPQLFREAWTFSACLSIAYTASRIGPPPPTPKPHPSSLPPLPAGSHRRAASELPLGPARPTPAGTNRHARSLSANEFAAISEGSTGGEASSTNDASSQPPDSDEDDDVDSLALGTDARQLSAESATLAHRKRLPRVRVGRESSVPNAGGGTRSAGKGRSSRRRASLDWRLPNPQPEIDWQLGVPGHLHGDVLADLTQKGEGGKDGDVASASQRSFWCLLGHLYVKARLALDTMSESLDLSASTPKTPKFTAANGSFTTFEAPERTSSIGGGHIVALASGDGQSMSRPSLGRPSLTPPMINTNMMTTESAIATPKAELSAGRGFESSATQHSRRLSRFGLEAGPSRAESATTVIHHHSRRSSISEVSTPGFSEADSVGSLMRRSSDMDVTRPEPDLRNIQTVEREVETASEDSGSPASLYRRGGGADSPTSALPWLTEWRLRLALTSAIRCQELWAELSGAAAACYAAASWKRTAQRLIGQVATAMMWRGNLPAAAALTQRRAQLLLREHWSGLAASLLLQVLECDRALHQVPDLALSLRLLALAGGPAAVDESAQAELQQSLSHAAAGDRALSRPGANGLGSENPDGSVNCPGVLYVKPIGSHFSRFFGQSEVDGEPITSTSVQSPEDESVPPGRGAPQVSVGDVVRLPVSLVSKLPLPLELSSCQLVLSVLQEMTVVLSPRGGQEQALTRGHGHLRTASVLTVDSSQGGRADPPTPATAAATDGPQRFGTKWQETERVMCTPVAGGAALVLQPGRNTLWFEVTPLKRGLYALRHAVVTLGNLQLRLAASAEEPSGAPAVLGACNAAGELGEEAVLLHVDPASRRVSSRAAAPTGCLVAGTPQWLGVALVPQHDTLQAASLRVQPSHAAGIDLELQRQPASWIMPLGSPEEAASPAEEGEAWQPGEGGAGPLPAWAAHQPSLLWLWVQAGPLTCHREVVRVSPLSSHTPMRPQPAELSTPMTSPPPMASLAGPHGFAEVDVDVEYTCGCPRGHTSRLSIPVLPPFRIKVSGKELPGGRVVLQLQLTSCLSGPAIISGVDLEPQPGFKCLPDPPELAALLPLKVPAGSSASLLLFLSASEARPAEEGRGGRLDSLLQLHFSHTPWSPPHQAVQEVTNDWTPPLLGASPRPPPTVAMPQGAGQATQRHAFALDLGAASSAPRSTVYIRLLGPFSAKSGELVTFCWRLERGAEAGGELQGGLLQYEVRAEGEVWRPTGTRSGWVRLPNAGRSSATVEAACVATAPGLLPVPQLLLPDVPHQEVFDVGEDNHLITVA